MEVLQSQEKVVYSLVEELFQNVLENMGSKAYLRPVKSAKGFTFYFCFGKNKRSGKWMFKTTLPMTANQLLKLAYRALEDDLKSHKFSFVSI